MKWGKLEPVRAFLYSILVPLVGLLVTYGVAKENWVPVLIGLGTAVLGGGATEFARAKVIPAAKTEMTGNIVNDVADQVVPVIIERIATSGQDVNAFIDQFRSQVSKFGPQVQGTWNQGFAPTHAAPDPQPPQEMNPYR